MSTESLLKYLCRLTVTLAALAVVGSTITIADASAKTRACAFTGDAWSAPAVKKLRAINTTCLVADVAASNIRGGWAASSTGRYPAKIAVHGASWNAGTFRCRYTDVITATWSGTKASCRSVRHPARRVTMRLVGGRLV